MSYRRNYYGGRKSYTRTKQQVPAKNPSVFSVNEYLENEFFNADEKTFSNIVSLYAELYGIGPRNYLVQTYHLWKSKSVKPNPTTIYNILRCIPPFLTFEKRFFILEQQIEFFIKEAIIENSTGSKRYVSFSELPVFYELVFARIGAFGEKELDWFIGKQIVDKKTADTIVRVCRHTIAMRLNAQFSIVIKTIKQIDSVISNVPLGTISASYTIDWLSITIGIPSGGSLSFEELAYKNYPMPDMDNNISLVKHLFEKSHRIYIDNNLEYESSLISSDEVLVALSVFRSLIKKKLKIKANQRIITVIGEINLIYKIESKNEIIKGLLFSLIKITAPITFILLVLFANNHEWHKFISFILVIGFYTLFTPALYLLICVMLGFSELYESLQTLASHGKQYEWARQA
jgi:hypothetical protein